jgi:hypothetical protein
VSGRTWYKLGLRGRIGVLASVDTLDGHNRVMVTHTHYPIFLWLLSYIHLSFAWCPLGVERVCLQKKFWEEHGDMCKHMLKKIIGIGQGI